MAYSKKELENKALEAIKKHSIIYIDEVVTFLPCSLKTFYNHKLHELPTIKKEIEDTKISIKTKLRQQWFKSTSPILQLALYKLISNEQELSVLNNSEYNSDDKLETVDFIYKKA